MQNGYYLATYMQIDELANIYETAERHDQNASLWLKRGNNIELVHFWELERITGKKKHRLAFNNVEQAKALLNSLLSRYNLTLAEIKEIWGTPGLQTGTDYDSLDDFPEYSYHSIAHLFSALLLDSSLFYSENIIGLAIDGAPDSISDHNKFAKYYFTGAYSKKGQFELFPVASPGVFWQMAASYFKLREGSLMALASASTSKTFIDVSCLLHDYLLVKNAANEQYIWPYFGRLFNTVMNFTEKEQGILFNDFDPHFSIEENKISMVMKIIQELSIKIMEVNLDQIIARYQIKPEQTYLALAGGYILNCPSNSHLMKKYCFKGFLAPPCVSDCGLSLGMALYAFYKKNKQLEFRLPHAYYGDHDRDLDRLLQDRDYREYIHSCSEFNAERAVDDLLAAPIVWFSGQAEIGPRALGNRSILADPGSMHSKDQLNRIKQRQWWRPVAPIILEEELGAWFEDAYPSPYMLHTFTIRPEKVKILNAIAHFDNSARVQTIAAGKEQGHLYALMTEFKKKTGVPILCNTSLNDRGEPIINKIPEAVNFALRKGIKVIYVNGNRIELQKHAQYPVPNPLPRMLFHFELAEKLKQQRKREMNPLEITDYYMHAYINLPGYRSKFDIRKQNDKKAVLYVLQRMEKKAGWAIFDFH